MATWPATLPAPAIDSLRESPPKNKLRTQMDKGPAKQRRRTTANTRPLSFVLKLTAAQVQILDDFFTGDTAYGVTEFNYTHPRTGDSVTAQFVDEPQYNEQAGVLYNVSVSLEVLP